MTKTTKEIKNQYNPALDFLGEVWYSQSEVSMIMEHQVKVIDQLRKELKELRPSMYKQFYNEQIDTLLNKFSQSKEDKHE